MRIFTPQERNALIFCISVFIISQIVQYCIKRNIHPQVLSPIQETDIRINLNTASQAQLELLRFPKAVTQAIISYRREKGNIRSLEELNQIKGIGEIRYRKLRQRCFVQ